MTLRSSEFKGRYVIITRPGRWLPTSFFVNNAARSSMKYLLPASLVFRCLCPLRSVLSAEASLVEQWESSLQANST